MKFSKLFFTFLAFCDASDDVHRLSNSFSMYEKRDESIADHEYVDEGLLSGFLRRGRPSMSAADSPPITAFTAQNCLFTVRVFISIIYIPKPIRHTLRKDAHDKVLDRL